MTTVVQKLAPAVTLIRNSNGGPFTLTGTNTYLIQNTTDPKTYTLLDTGSRPELLDPPDSYIPSLWSNIPDGSWISDVIVSHWHMDHIGGLDSVLNKLSKVPKIWTHPSLASHAENLAEHSISISSLSFSSLRDSTFYPPRPSLRIYFTPGHTDDSISLFDPDLGILWTADTVLGEGTSVFSNLGDYLRSLEKLQKIVEEFDKPVKIFPGHGPVVQDGLPKIKEYILHRKMRENQIVAQLSPSTSQTIEELVAKIYPEVKDDRVKFAAGMGVSQVLDVLKDRGTVTEHGEGWIIKSGKL